MVIKNKMLKDKNYMYRPLIKKIVNSLKNYQPEKIILFGSYHEGTYDKYSDIDLVVIKRTNKPFLERLKEIIKFLDIPIKVDVLVYTPEEWSLLEKQKNILVEIVNSKGDLLYEKQYSGSKPMA